MIKKSFVIASFAIVFVFGSCVSLSKTSFNIIEPSKVFIPHNFKNIVVVNAVNSKRTGSSEKELEQLLYLDSLAAENLVQGIMEGYNNSIFYNDTLLPYVRIIKSDTSYNASLYTWKEIEAICKKTNADLFLAIEYYRTEAKIDFKDYYFNVVVHPKVLLKIYDPVEYKLIDSYLYNDTLVWDYSFDEADNPPEQYKLLQEMVKSAGYWAGSEYVERIFPYWKNVNRFYYVNEHSEFKKADYYIKSNEIELAAKEWLKFTSSNDKTIAAHACFNMAVAFEMLDHLDKALVWAEKSNKLQESSLSKKYVSALKKRITDKEKLVKAKFISNE